MALTPVIMVSDAKKTGIKTQRTRVAGQAARVIVEDAESTPKTAGGSMRLEPKEPRDSIIFPVLEMEGGWSEDARDSGGRTHYGITEAVAQRHGLDVRTITKADAIEIYVRDYWETLELDLIAERCPVVAERLFDIGVNMGIGRAAEWLQRILNALNQNGRQWPDIAVDGDIGNETMQAFEAYIGARGTNGCAVLADYLRAMQGHFYIDLAERRPKDEAFVYGWGKRLPDRMPADMGLDNPVQRQVADPSESYAMSAEDDEPAKNNPPKPKWSKNPLDWFPYWKTHAIMLVTAGIAAAELFGVTIPEQVYVILGALGLSTAYRGMTRNKAKGSS